MTFKTAQVGNKRIAYTSETTFLVQVSRNKGSYKTKYSFTGNIAQAFMHFNGVNVHSGYNKRLIMVGANKPVIARVRT